MIKTIENCAHGSFTCDLKTVTNLNYQVAIIRCTDCGEAIGAFLPQLPDALNKIGAGLETLHKDLQTLSR